MLALELQGFLHQQIHLASLVSGSFYFLSPNRGSESDGERSIGCTEPLVASEPAVSDLGCHFTMFTCKQGRVCLDSLFSFFSCWAASREIIGSQTTVFTMTKLKEATRTAGWHCWKNLLVLKTRTPTHTCSPKHR